MNYFEPFTTLLVYIFMVVIFIHATNKYQSKEDNALDCMIAYDEQSPAGPYHLIYRASRKGKCFYWVASVVTIYFTILEIKHVYTLITAG